MVPDGCTLSIATEECTSLFGSSRCRNLRLQASSAARTTLTPFVRRETVNLPENEHHLFNLAVGTLSASEFSLALLKNHVPRVWSSIELQTEMDIEKPWKACYPYEVSFANQAVSQLLFQIEVNACKSILQGPIASFRTLSILLCSLAGSVAVKAIPASSAQIVIS